MSLCGVALVVLGVVASVSVVLLEPPDPLFDEVIEEGVDAVGFEGSGGGKAFSGGVHISGKGGGFGSAGVSEGLEGLVGRVVESSDELSESGGEFLTSVVDDFLSGAGSVGKGGECLLPLGIELGAELLSVVLVVEGTDPCELLFVPLLNLLAEGVDDVLEGIESLLGGGDELLLGGNGAISLSSRSPSTTTFSGPACGFSSVPSTV